MYNLFYGQFFSDIPGQQAIHLKRLDIEDTSNNLCGQLASCSSNSEFITILTTNTPIKKKMRFTGAPHPTKSQVKLSSVEELPSTGLPKDTLPPDIQPYYLGNYYPNV